MLPELKLERPTHLRRKRISIKVDVGERAKAVRRTHVPLLGLYVGEIIVTEAGWFNVRNSRSLNSIDIDILCGSVKGLNS